MDWTGGGKDIIILIGQSYEDGDCPSTIIPEDAGIHPESCEINSDEEVWPDI
jgi:hypothetical protein